MFRRCASLIPRVHINKNIASTTFNTVGHQTRVISFPQHKKCFSTSNFTTTTTSFGRIGLKVGSKVGSSAAITSAAIVWYYSMSTNIVSEPASEDIEEIGKAIELLFFAQILEILDTTPPCQIPKDIDEQIAWAHKKVFEKFEQFEEAKKDKEFYAIFTNMYMNVIHYLVTNNATKTLSDIKKINGRTERSIIQ